MKVNLFALTGFGNVALKALKKNNIEVLKVYTRYEETKFPYYEEENLSDLAKMLNIPVQYVEKKGFWGVTDKVDLNIVTSFHRFLKKEQLQSAFFNVNFHPSLLPSYQGPTPTNWMIHNKEKFCGWTAYFIKETEDSNDFIYQEAYPLTSKTDSELRKFLAEKLEHAIEKVISEYPYFTVIQSPYPESFYDSYSEEVVKEI